MAVPKMTSTQTEAKDPSRQNRIWRNFKKTPAAWVGVGMLVLLVLAAIFAPQIAPHDPMEQKLMARLKPPIGFAGYVEGHWLGTDRLGRDVLSTMLHGLQVSLVVGVAGVAISALIGIPLGLISGYYKGWADSLIGRLIELQLAIPTILLAMGVMAAWGRGLEKLILVIGISGWAYYARTARASALQIREKEFVEAAHAAGAPGWQIIVRHIFPNGIAPLLVLACVEIPRVVLLEATLSFLGLGVPSNVASLGVMISEGQQVLFSGRWWVSVLPGVALMLLVFGVNLIGDWLRDALDPRMKDR